MAEAHKPIKRIKLSNDQIYSIFDEGALRLNEENILCTGNTIVDNIIISEGLSIKEIDDVPLADSNETVLTVNANGKIIKQNIRQVLRDLGLITATVKDETLNLDTVSINL